MERGGEGRKEGGRRVTEGEREGEIRRGEGERKEREVGEFIEDGGWTKREREREREGEKEGGGERRVTQGRGMEEGEESVRVRGG